MIYSNHFPRNIFTGDLLQQLSILLDIHNKYYLYFIFGEKLFYSNDTKVCPSAKSTMEWRGIVSTLLTPRLPQKNSNALLLLKPTRNLQIYQAYPPL